MIEVLILFPSPLAPGDLAEIVIHQSETAIHLSIPSECQTEQQMTFTLKKCAQEDCDAVFLAYQRSTSLTGDFARMRADIDRETSSESADSPACRRHEARRELAGIIPSL